MHENNRKADSGTKNVISITVHLAKRARNDKAVAMLPSGHSNIMIFNLLVWFSCKEDTASQIRGPENWERQICG